MIEVACKEADFHFNKKHLEDPEIPMWVIRARGKSYYVDHVTSNVPWSTKESSTKGSIKFKNVLLQIDDDNRAELSVLTPAVAYRLRESPQRTRILITRKEYVFDFLTDRKIAFTPFRLINGPCGKLWVCDIEDARTIRRELNTGYRILQENEIYYKSYDDTQIDDRDYIQEDLRKGYPNV